MPRPTDRDELRVWTALAELAAANDKRRGIQPDYPLLSIELEPDDGEPSEWNAEGFELIDAVIVQTIERSARKATKRRPRSSSPQTSYCRCCAPSADGPAAHASSHAPQPPDGS